MRYKEKKVWVRFPAVFEDDSESRCFTSGTWAGLRKTCEWRCGERHHQSGDAPRHRGGIRSLFQVTEGCRSESESGAPAAASEIALIWRLQNNYKSISAFHRPVETQQGETDLIPNFK